MKKLLIVTHNMAGGGCERVIAQLSNRFVADGIAVMLCTEQNAPCFYALDARVLLRPLTKSAVYRTRDIPKIYRSLRREAKAFRPDVILAMPEKVNVWAVAAMLFSGIPVVVSERNDPKRHPENRIKRLLRRLVYPFAAGYIFQTEEARAFFPPCIRARGIVLDNPLDLSRVPEPYAGEREKCVVAAGRLNAQKNFPLLVRAFAMFYESHPDWRLIIYGEGPERERLLSLAAKLPAGAVLLPGQSQTLLLQIASAGMFVLSSDFEGMPNVLLEAMATGLCCISTDCPCGGPRMLVEDGETGLLVPVNDAAALSKKMAYVAAHPDEARRLGENALLVRSRLDIGRVAQEWRDYLEKAIAHSGK